MIADAVINEYLLGNGPVYADCRHLPDEVLDHMEATLQVDRYTMPACGPGESPLNARSAFAAKKKSLSVSPWIL